MNDETRYCHHFPVIDRSKKSVVWQINQFVKRQIWDKKKQILVHFAFLEMPKSNSECWAIAMQMRNEEFMKKKNLQFWKSYHRSLSMPWQTEGVTGYILPVPVYITGLAESEWWQKPWQKL